MSVQAGTASDYLDLIEKLDLFLTQTGHAWGKAYVGTGSGDLTAYLGTAASVAETFTLTAINATTFSVVGSVSGALADATVDTPYSSAKIAFTIEGGGTAFVAGDVFTINTSPAWQRLARWGCADTRKWTTNLNNPQNLLPGASGIASGAFSSSQIDFEMVTPTTVRRIAVLANATNASTRMPTSYTLRWKDNAGDAWTTAHTFTRGAFANNEGAVFMNTAETAAHRFWRVEMTAPSSTTEIAELVLYRDVAGDIMASARAQWAWQAPGLDGTRAILSSAATAHNQAADRFNVMLQGFRTWDATLPIELQPGNSGERALCLGTSSIAYWFVVNGQRAIVATRFGSLYQFGYMGFGLPYEPPSAHQYPYLLGASYRDSSLRYDSTSIEYRFPADPGPDTLRAYYPDSTWKRQSNRFNQSGGGTEGTYDSRDGYRGKVWPASFGENTTALNFIRDNIDGSRVLIPCVLFHEEPAHVWGEFDGVYWCTGFSTVSEAVIRQDGFDHLVLQNIFRNSQKDFAAVRLD